MRRHRLDPFSLVFGTAFTCLGLIFLLSKVDVVRVHAQWTWPLPLVALGLLIIALAARRTEASPSSGDEAVTADGEVHLPPEAPLPGGEPSSPTAPGVDETPSI